MVFIHVLQSSLQVISQHELGYVNIVCGKMCKTSVWGIKSESYCIIKRELTLKYFGLENENEEDGFTV